MENDYQCKVCGNTRGNREYVAREMMFGMRDEFLYFQCACCGCLQIAEAPTDLAKYYPSDRYYSYQNSVAPRKGLVARLKNLIKKGMGYTYFCLKMPVQQLPYLRNFSWLWVLRSVNKADAILDVGCGSGAILQQMRHLGFKNLTGVDPFIEKDILYPSGVRVWKTDVYNYPPPPNLLIISKLQQNLI